MKFNELEIFINAQNEIVLKQKDSMVRITADQAQITAEEIQGLGEQLLKEMIEEANKTKGE